MKAGYIERSEIVSKAYLKANLFGGLTFYYDGVPQFFTFKAVVAENAGITDDNTLRTLSHPTLDNTTIEIDKRPELPKRFGQDYNEYLKMILRIIFTGTRVTSVSHEKNGTYDVESFNMNIKPDRFDNHQITLAIIGLTVIELSVLHDLSSTNSLFDTLKQAEENVYVADNEFQLELQHS